MRDWMTAAVAGFLEMDGRRVRASQDLPEPGSSTHPDPDAILHAWVQAATVVLDLGEQPCAGCLTVLHELYSADGPPTMAQLASAVRAALEPQEQEEPEGLPCPGCGEVHSPGGLLSLSDFLGDENEDEEDAASHAAASVTGLLGFGAADVTGETVRLTPLGTVLATSVFRAREPSPDADAATVMSAISELPPPVAWTVAQPWLGARSAADAARELLAFAESADGGQRVASLALAVIGRSQLGLAEFGNCGLYRLFRRPTGFFGLEKEAHPDDRPAKLAQKCARGNPDGRLHQVE